VPDGAEPSACPVGMMLPLMMMSLSLAIVSDWL
jgi:hypothetical protein